MFCVLINMNGAYRRVLRAHSDPGRLAFVSEACLHTWRRKYLYCTPCLCIKKTQLNKNLIKKHQLKIRESSQPFTLKQKAPLYQKKATRGEGIYFSVHTTCPVNQHRNINYMFESGLSSSFSGIWSVIHVQPHTEHLLVCSHCSLEALGLTHAGSTCVFAFNFPNTWAAFNMPPISLLCFKASFGVRRLIGVTEIEKGSSYGNQEFKKKE